jgi:integrase
VRPREDDRLVFTSPQGGEIDYNNWRLRRWLPLLKATAPDGKHPKRVAVTGTPHMLRHAYATALIQAGENAKTVQTLMGHHSVAFTMDQYADAWPEALSNAGEKAAALLFAASGSKTVAAEAESGVDPVSWTPQRKVWRGSRWQRQRPGTRGSLSAR